MYLRGNPLYPNFDALWAGSYRSPYFSAIPADEAPEEDLSLSERLLFTQSNGRLLLGQDACGRLHFLCSPHETDYAIPSGGPRVGGQFGGHIGQFYQSDLAMLLGKLDYEIHLGNGLLLNAAGDDAETWYLDHFMPVTRTVRPYMETRVFSLAPVLEPEARKASSIHPLPGPCGALFCLYITNTSPVPLRGTVKLRLDQRFVVDNEEYGMVFEEAAVRPYHCEWDRKLLTMWRPDAYATVQFIGANQSGDADNPQLHVPFELAPGESRLFTTIATATPDKSGAHAALGTLYQHLPLEWINITAAFWRERLGQLDLRVREDAEAGAKYRDMQMRFILDDFNCLMFAEDGRMLANWQGAPSHGLCRLWGIDIEPTVISVLYAVPEIGPSAVRYMADRSVPRYSIYPDHSMPIYVAPLIIAGKYYELTGDISFLRDDPVLIRKLREHVDGMLRHKHAERALFTSRYASDLIVFKRYDYCTQVKCFCALGAWAKLMGALGEDAGDILALMDRMRSDMAGTMEADGPFGRQITGGTSLGEALDERFYIEDELYYYGGEDSFTCMAPLYGLYEFDYLPWVNLHRYARSLFITNYDPEYQSMRELHYGMNPSATGNTLRLGGSTTRSEMRKSLDILFHRLDVSGSLFWWPRAENKRRCLTRCSQGQGSWVQQSCEQWLGWRMDAANHTLTIRPQGLIDGYKASAVRIGGFRFDIDWQESESGAAAVVRNLNGVPFKVVLGARPFGTGSESKLAFADIELAPGEEKRINCSAGSQPVDDLCVGKVECDTLAEGGAVFGPYGLAMPKLGFGETDVFLLRFAVMNAGDCAWDRAEVTLSLPEGFLAAEKRFFHWDYLPDFEGREVTVTIENVPPNEHRVAGFYVRMPARMAGGNNVILNRHPFTRPARQNPEPVCLVIGAKRAEAVDGVTATMKAPGTQREFVLPVAILAEAEYQVEFDRMIHG